MVGVPLRLDYLNDRTSLACVCGGQTGPVIRRRDRYGLKFRFRLCARCGHVWNSTPLSESATTKFYRSSDFRTMYFNGESPVAVLKRKSPRPNTESLLLSYVRQQVARTGSVIEWGCSGGWNLVAFRDAGWTTQGFDYDRTYIQLGRSEFGLDLNEIDGDKLSADPIDQPDVVLLNHVLEHSPDPVSLLRRIRELCSDQSLLVVGIPLLETIQTWHWKDFFHIAHIHYFSSRSFEYVARKAGFEVKHANLEKGLFALSLSPNIDTLTLRRQDVLRSAWLVARGYIEPRHRTLMAIRGTLKVLGLHNLARRLKHVILK